MLDTERRKKSQVGLPSDKGKPKYSTEPHPLLRLSRSAFPSEAEPSLIENAVEQFSCSVTSATQSGYATAARHYIAAEKSLGRQFSHPPSETEMVYLVAYLVGKKLSVPTIRSYLAGIRFYLLSMGIPTPPTLPPLADQLLIGMSKGGRDAVALASRKTRRAISAEMLKLIEHAIALRQDWSVFEKSLRWAVTLVAWWGAFRIGELLPKNKQSYDPKSSLLASDVKFANDSVALWIRSPKVEREATGDVVEV